MSRLHHRFYRSCLVAASLLLGSAGPAFAQLNPTVSTNGTNIGRYLPFEITLAHTPQTPYANPFWGVTIDATFASPGGATYSLGGFYYDTNRWMVRFSPLIEGTWLYALTMTAPDGTFETSGTFECAASTLHGPLRVHPTNPMRLVRDDGTAFNGIGTNLYTNVHPFLNGGWTGGNPCTPLDVRWSIYFAAWAAKGGNLYRRMVGNEGVSNYDIAHCADPLPNPYDTFSGYIGIWNDEGPDQYSTARSLLLDVELSEARKNDVAVCLTLLDKQLHWDKNPLNACNGGPFSTSGNCSDHYAYPPDFLALVNGGAPPGSSAAYHELYFRYMVNRYSAFVDVWQLFGEYDESTGSSADHYGLTTAWKSYMAERIREFHPYNDLVTTGRPGNNGAVTDPWQDILDAHRYTYTQDVPGPVDLCQDCGPGYNPTLSAQGVDALYGPLTTVSGRGARPFLFGECGFFYNLANDDPAYFRIAVWMAFHRNADLAFWNALQRYDCSTHPNCANGLFVSSTYQSNVSRDYYQLRQTYAAKVPATARIAGTLPTGFDGSMLRVWALSAPDDVDPTKASAYSAYVHNFASHTQSTSGKLVTINGLTNAAHKYEWTDPKTGATVEASSFSGMSRTFTIPTFVQDTCLLITPDEPVHIVTTSVPLPVPNEPYFQLLEASGGGLPYTWSIVSGAVPNGMLLDAESGLLSGALQYGGSTQFTVRVTAQDASFDDLAVTFQHWTETFDSIAAEDGYASMSSGPGHPVGAVSNDSTTAGIRMGDSSGLIAFRGIVSFGTSSLPDTAVIDSARLELKSDETAGSTAGFPPRQLVVKTGNFGQATLQGSDYAAAGTVTQTFPNIAIPGQPWTLMLNAAARGAINKTGKTQMRVQWSLENDNDGVADWTGFCPGEFSVAAKRPHLVVTYH